MIFFLLICYTDQLIVNTIIASREGQMLIMLYTMSTYGKIVRALDIVPLIVAQRLRVELITLLCLGDL